MSALLALLGLIVLIPKGVAIEFLTSDITLELLNSESTEIGLD